MGEEEPPRVPQQVLNSALHPSWSDGSLQDKLLLMAAGHGNAAIEVHDTVRDDVFYLMLRLTPSQTPSLRTVLRHSPRTMFKDRPFQLDPHNLDGEFETRSGKVDYGLYARVPGTTNPLPSQIILVIEIKPATKGAVCPKQARAVDLQIRARANAARDSGVNKHFYLIGWVGCWFRPYYWCQASGKVETGMSPRFARMRQVLIILRLEKVSIHPVIPELCVQVTLTSLSVTRSISLVPMSPSGGIYGSQTIRNCYSKSSEMLSELAMMPDPNIRKCTATLVTRSRGCKMGQSREVSKGRVRDQAEARMHMEGRL